MKTLVPAAAIAILLGTSGAARTAPLPGFAPTSASPKREARRCPQALRSVALVTSAVDGGVAIELTSPRAREVAALREQLREAALSLEMYSKRPVRPEADDPSPAEVQLPPLDVSVKDVGAGARVIIRAERARDLPELLELTRALELFWSRSDCNREVGPRPLNNLPSMQA